MYEAACRRGSWQTPVISRRRYARPTTTRKGFPTAYRTGALCAAGCRLPPDAMFSGGRSKGLPSRRGNHSFFWRIRARRTLKANKFGNRICSCHSTLANVGIVGEGEHIAVQVLGTSLDTYGASRDSRTRDLLSPPSVEGIRYTSERVTCIPRLRVAARAHHNCYGVRLFSGCGIDNTGPGDFSVALANTKEFRVQPEWMGGTSTFTENENTTR